MYLKTNQNHFYCKIPKIILKNQRFFSFQASTNYLVNGKLVLEWVMERQVKKADMHCGSPTTPPLVRSRQWAILLTSLSCF